MRRSIKKVAAGLLATMMIGTMLTGCGGGNKKDSGSSKKETSEINIGFSQVGAESDWRVANTKSMKSELTAKNGFKLSFASFKTVSQPVSVTGAIAITSTPCVINSLTAFV